MRRENLPGCCQSQLAALFRQDISGTILSCHYAIFSADQRCHNSNGCTFSHLISSSAAISISISVSMSASASVCVSIATRAVRLQLQLETELSTLGNMTRGVESARGGLIITTRGARTHTHTHNDIYVRRSNYIC